MSMLVSHLIPIFQRRTKQANKKKKSHRCLVVVRCSFSGLNIILLCCVRCVHCRGNSKKLSACLQNGNFSSWYTNDLQKQLRVAKKHLDIVLRTKVCREMRVCVLMYGINASWREMRRKKRRLIYGLRRNIASASFADCSTRRGGGRAATLGGS